MVHIDLEPDGAIVRGEFLLRFRDQEKLSIEHRVEANVLWDLCALLEFQVPELTAICLRKREIAVASPDWE
jgi:hypothetical protein